MDLCFVYTLTPPHFDFQALIFSFYLLFYNVKVRIIRPKIRPARILHIYTAEIFIFEIKNMSRRLMSSNRGGYRMMR